MAMTTNTIFITPDADNDIELELKAEITEICTASVNTPGWQNYIPYHDH